MFGSRLVAGVLFHLMRQLVRASCAAAPKAVLAQLILATLLAFVAEAVEVGALTDHTGDRMHDALNDGEPMKRVEPNETGRSAVGQHHVDELVETDLSAPVKAGVGQRVLVAERRLLVHGRGQLEEIFEASVKLLIEQRILRRVAYLREYELDLVD